MTIEQLTASIAQASGLAAGEASFEVEKGLDATNDKAVWVWIAFQHWPDFPFRQQLRDKVREHVQEVEGVDYVYTYFQDAAEVAAMQVKK